MRDLLREVFAPLGTQLEDIVQLVMDTIELEKEVLIYGKVDGKQPSTVLCTLTCLSSLIRVAPLNAAAPQQVVKRNGQAYLEGWDTWSELGAMVSPSASTQPNKLGIVDVRYAQITLCPAGQ